MSDHETELTDYEKMFRLRVLVQLELEEARRQAAAPHSGDSAYVLGRIASYEFVIDAIERRWPDLEYEAREDRSELVRHHDAFLAIRAVVEAGLSGGVDPRTALHDIQQLVG